MKTVFALLALGSALALSSQSIAAQEGFGMPQRAPRPSPVPGPARPGALRWRDYQCGIPKRDGHNVYGAGAHMLKVETVTMDPENVRAVVLLSRPLHPGAKWTRQVLMQQHQDRYSAVFANRYATVTIDKSNMSAQVDLNNAIMDCETQP